MQFLANLAVQFNAIFEAGSETLLGLAGGILPKLLVLLTAVNALVTLIGPERVNALGKKAGSKGAIWWPVRYVVFPLVNNFILGAPMNFVTLKFLPDEYKPALYDVSTRGLHYMNALFPHVLPGEIFVYMGIFQGLLQLGLSTADIAVRYLLAGIVIMLLSGILTEKIYALLVRRKRAAAAAPRAD